MEIESKSKDQDKWHHKNIKCPIVHRDHINAGLFIHLPRFSRPCKLFLSIQVQKYEVM
jgi:hypothetical protein